MKVAIVIMAASAFNTWLASVLGIVSLAFTFASLYTLVTAWTIRRLVS